MKTNMKKSINLLKTVLFLIAIGSIFGCNKKEEMTVIVDSLWFPKEACVQELKVTANCRWSISIDDAADWYTIDPMSGRKDESLKITVKALSDVESRNSSFTITSDKGTVQLLVRVSQNTDEPTELKSITDMVFGVANVAHWNVDFYGEVIEESYHNKEYSNPYDTASGYVMYFFQDSIGIQRDNVNGDSTTYYSFKYFFDPETRILHVEFETIGDESEIYDAPVLVATEELFRFQHEYKPMRWEIADMRKIGTLHPNQKTRIMQTTKKRTPKGGIFQF
jgi:hypothetical protein